MATRTTTVYATTQFTGYHHWPEAPATRFYLRDLHRHVFGVQVEIEVDHPERAIEFHDLKEGTDYIISKKLELPFPFGLNIHLRTLSCEGMASLILDEVIKQWPDRASYYVSVDEDGENGASVTHRE